MRTIRNPVVTLAVVAVLTMIGNGCGGNDGVASTTFVPAATTTAQSETTVTPTSSTTPTTGTSVAADDDESGVITAAFVSFFDGVVRDVDAKVNGLEHGEVYRSMLADAVANPQFAQMSTQVAAVTMLDANACAAAAMTSPCARVVHNLLLGQFPAVVDKTSYAVKIDGSWKVAAQTWCDVVAIGGASCPP